MSYKFVNINNIIIMKQEIFNGAAIYTAPELTFTDVSVEKGFAESGLYNLGGAGSYDEDYINDNGSY